VRVDFFFLSWPGSANVGVHRSPLVPSSQTPWVVGAHVLSALGRWLRGRSTHSLRGPEASDGHSVWPVAVWQAQKDGPPRRHQDLGPEPDRQSDCGLQIVGQPAARGGTVEEADVSPQMLALYLFA